jgi:hypothetical protein
MGRVRLLTVLMVSSALVLVAANAQAQAAFNRPEILDASDGSSYTEPGPSSARVGAAMFASAYGPEVAGYMWASEQDSSTRVELLAYLWQPDSMMRTHRRAKANQKRYMFIKIALRTVPYGSPLTTRSDIVEDCKGTMTADDRDNDGIFDLNPRRDDRIRGSLRCHRDVLDELDFSTADIDTIQGIIGNRIRLNINLP